jgi:hypothetical protein
VSLGYSTNQKVVVDRVVEIDCPPFTADDGLSQQHPQPPPKIRARFMWDPPASLRSSSSSYFSSLSNYFSFLSSATPSLPSLAPPSHWYPAYWRRDDAGEDVESEDDVSHAFSPTAFSPTSASFYSPPQTPGVTGGPASPPPPPVYSSTTSTSPAASAPSSSASTASFHVFSPSSYRTLFPTLWKKDEEERESKALAEPVQIPVGEDQDEFHEEGDGATRTLAHERDGNHVPGHGDDDNDEEDHRTRRRTDGGEKNERKSGTGGEEAKLMDHDGPCLVLHVHGGGFVSQSSQSHLSYLKQWAALTGIPILTIDYRCAHTPLTLALSVFCLGGRGLVSTYSSLSTAWRLSIPTPRPITSAMRPTSGHSLTIASWASYQVRPLRVSFHTDGPVDIHSPRLGASRVAQMIQRPRCEWLSWVTLPAAIW